MPPIEQFNAPSNLQDMTAENIELWSRFLSRFFEHSQAGLPSQNDGPRAQFFHPLRDEIEGELITEEALWTAFPRQVSISSVGDVQRWRTADRDRNLQDEYCEWCVTRDEEGQITQVTFTTEGPEYWNVMATLQPETVLELYRDLVSPEVERSDVLPNGIYNPTNRWNNSTTSGIAHLIQPNNTLGAEIELAAGASTVRRRNAQIVQDTQALIECGRYGAPQRHSDPHIGSVVNRLARGGRKLSLFDPVGLYIAGLDLEDFETPTAEIQPADCWHIIRGGNRPVRAIFTPPEGAGFTASDVTIGGRAIRFGGQIADHLTIGLTGWATSETNHLRVVEGCVGDPQVESGFEPLAALATIFDLEAPKMPSRRLPN